MAREPIRLRLVPRKPFPDAENPREAFWRAVFADFNRDRDVTLAEGKLCREFGWELRQSLVRHLSQPLDRLVERRFYGPGGGLGDLLFRLIDGPRYDKELDRSQIISAISRLIEQDQDTLRENIAAKSAKEKMALASSVIFSLHIVGYSSLSLDMSVGSINKVAEIFENDFDSFRVFLDAFVPVAFAEVFNRDDSDRVDFSVQIPDTYRHDFSGHPSRPLTNSPSLVGSEESAMKKLPQGRERAEWLWRLANGSLLVPVILALAVMYEGMLTLKSIYNMQYDAMKPVLDLQLGLLEEDRARLLKDFPAALVPANAVAPTTKP